MGCTLKPSKNKRADRFRPALLSLSLSLLNLDRRPAKRGGKGCGFGVIRRVNRFDFNLVPAHSNAFEVARVDAQGFVLRLGKPFFNGLLCQRQRGGIDGFVNTGRDNFAGNLNSCDFASAVHELLDARRQVTIHPLFRVILALFAHLVRGNALFQTRLDGGVRGLVKFRFDFDCVKLNNALFEQVEIICADTEHVAGRFARFLCGVRHTNERGAAPRGAGKGGNDFRQGGGGGGGHFGEN